MPDAPLHGGNLQQAIETWGIPRERWLDLSTGITPFPWPVPMLPQEVWQRLPEQDGQLEQAIEQYYGCQGLAVPGSQWAIQHLPRLFSPRRVWLAQESYEEYPFWWQQQGHQVLRFNALPKPAQLQTQDVVIAINPNNPDARLHSPQQLRELALQLAQRDGWLIVDEAFMDATPEHSLLPDLPPAQNMLVLRSLGKFFGLAGIRMGALFGNTQVRSQLAQRLGPWAISHPARWIATQALQDKVWQQQQRQRLHQASQELATLLLSCFPADSVESTPLFVSVKLASASALLWQQQLASQGIWVRAFPHWNRLRFGVPDSAGLQRLAQALAIGVSS